ncbi:MAG: T9SS type A sorting domain-containing protein [Lentimicrobiaceae bacterium]|nr:T9SS type A sorting domain-containing protein [Lentimicrobiaceae bacterium]
MRTKSFILTFLMMMFCSVSFGQTSKWGIPDTHCESTMTMITKIVIDGVVQGSDVEIAAFCGDELRGTARPDVQDGNIVYLVIHGNNPEQNESAEVISFRFYDHAADRELFYPYPDIEFEDNKVIGSYSSVINGNGLINLTSIAEVNGIGYGSLDAAINAAQANNVIVLLADVVAETNPVNIPADVTLNLNTHTIQADILGTVKTNGGLWVTPQDYKMIGKDADIYATNAATVITDANNITIEEGDVTLVPTEWWTAQGQNLTIDANANFTIKENSKFNVMNGTTVTVNGNVVNNGTLVINSGATVNGNLIGDIHFKGGNFITADNYKMVGTTSDYYYNTTDALVNIAGQFGDITIKSGEMTLGKSWRTVQGQTLTIASGAEFTVPANMTFEVFQNTHVIVNGTLVTDGTVYLQLNATVKAAEGLNVTTNVADHKVVYEDGVYKVVAKNYVAQTETGAKFETLKEAIDAANETVTLLQPAIGAGLVINKNITIDFGGKTYTINQAVGSTGTESQGFQLLKNNTVTLKNGNIAIAENTNVKWMFNAYANVTLQDLNVNCANMKAPAEDEANYVLVVNNGGGATPTVNYSNITIANLPTGATPIWLDPTTTFKAEEGLKDLIETEEGYVVAYEDGEYTAEKLRATFTGGAYARFAANKPREHFSITLQDVYASESLVVKVYHNETLLLTTTYRDEDLDAPGVNRYPVSATKLTVNNVVAGKVAGSWDNTYAEGIRLDITNVPNKFEVYVDGILTDTYDGTENPNAGFSSAENLKTYLGFTGVYKAASVTRGTDVTYYMTLAEAWDATQNGDIVTLYDNVTLASRLDVTNKITLNLNAKNITANFEDQFGAIYVKKGAELTIEGEGDITSNSSVAIGTYGTVNIKGGNITSGEGYAALYVFYYPNHSEGTANISGGRLNVVWNCGILNVSGGQIDYLDTSSELDVTDGVITKMLAKDGSDASGAYEMNIQNIETTVPTVEVPEHFKFVEIRENVYKVVEKVYIAQTETGAKFETLQEAVNAGTTVTLLDNATGAGVYINKDVTIDFATYTYTVNQAVGSAGTETLGFQILKDNDVTLKNGTLTSTAAVEGSKEVKMLIQNYANLTLTDMNLVDNTDHILYALSNNSGTTSIEGATSITTDEVAFDVYDYTYGGYAETPVVYVNTTGKITGKIEVSESISNNLNIKDGSFTNPIAEAWCAVGYIPTTEVVGGITYYTVKVGEYVAQVNDGAKYESLVEAYDAAQSGATVKLLKDATGAGLKINKDITIDFGGKTYTINQAVGSAGTESQGFQLLKNNTVTLKNGNIAIAENTNVKWMFNAYANVTLQDLNVNCANMKAPAEDEANYVLVVNNGGGATPTVNYSNITIANLPTGATPIWLDPTTTFKAEEGLKDLIETEEGYVVAYEDGEYTAEKLRATFTGGAYARFAANKPREHFSITLQDVYASESLVVKVYHDETLLLTTTYRAEDLDAPGVNRYPVSAERLTVNNVVSGKVAGSWLNEYMFENVYSGNKHFAVNNVPNKFKVYVDGILTDTYDGTQNPNAGFSSAENLKTYLGFDGVYKAASVTRGTDVTYYMTLAEAWNATQDGDIVTLYDNAELASRLDVTNKITLNLNGKNITANFDDSYGAIYVKKDAKLTIEGEGDITSNSLAIGTYGTVNIKGGNITTTGSDDAALYVFYYPNHSEGTANISGGRLNVVWNCGTLNVSGGQIDYLDTSSELNVTGGVITKMLAKDGSDASGAYEMNIQNIETTVPTVEVPADYKFVEIRENVYQVVAKNYIAETETGAKFETLKEAIDAANETVTLLQTATGAGVVIDKDITIDFGGYTYSFNEGVGSGSLTSNGFQLLGGNVVLKNGTLKVADADASEFYILVQNYTNLTVENMTLDGTNLDKWSKVQDNWDSYTLSNNSGEVYIKGSTIIVNNDGVKSFAFDVDDNANYTSKPVVYVANLEDRETLIQGQIEVDLPNNLNISGGLFTVEIKEAWCADGYIPTQTEDGKWTVKLGEYVARVNGQGYETFDAALAADGEVIVIKPIVITEDKEYNFTNEKITGDNVYPIFRIQNGATMIVTGGEVTNPTDYVFVLGASDGSSHGDLIINGGKYHGATTVASVTLGALTITGGEFSVEPYEGNYAFLINCIDANYKNGTASVAITGGTFHNWNPQNNAAEGTGTDFCYVDHAATETAENVWTVLPAVAEIGEARFATLQDAVNAAQANETINLIANVQLTKFVTIDKSVNLNLGQFDITRNDGTALYVNGENIQVAIYGTGKVSGYQAVFVNNGIVTINGGNFVGNPEAVYVINNGHAVINGGRFETIDSDKRYVLNEYDATRDVTTINVYGGTFVGFDPENNAAEGAGTNFCAEGYISDDNGDGTFTVRRGEYIAQIAETGAKYETLQAAYEAANANHTIVLLQNVTLDATFAIAKGVTLNGSENNYKLTVNANGIPAVKVNTNDDVIFKNLVIESTGYNNGSQTHGVHIAKKANVTFDNVDVNSVYSVFVESSAAESVINVNNGSKLYADMSGIYAKGKVTINVTNSWVEKYYNGGSAIYVNGEYSVVNVVNSTIKATSTSNAHFAAFEIGADNVTVNVDENSKIEVINSSYDIYAFYVGDKELNNRVLTNHNIIIADGATINKNKETDPVIYIKDAEVKVTKDNVATMMYFRLIDALAVSHVEGETMTILKPVVLTENAALNIEGRTIITAENVYPAIRVQNDAEVTITGEGTIKNDDYVFVVGASDASSAGNLTIENGTYVGETTVAQVTLGKLNITGGDFSITDVETYDYAYLINCKDEYYNAGTAQVEIKGGTFHNFNPQNNAAEGAGTNFCAEGYGAYESAPNVWTVRGAVARIGDRYFAKVADATSAAVTGDIVYLLDNVNDAEVTVDLNTAKKITIDLGDFTYTSTGTAFIAYRNGTELTITNGTVNGNGAAGGTLRATYNATLILGADLTVNAGPQATAIVIQDGKFFVNPNTENVIVNGGIDCIKVQENVLEVSIASGTYTEDVQEWCPQGYVSQNNGDGTWTVTLAQIITLEERWNWVSHYVVGNTDSDILTQLKNGLGAYGVQIKNQNEFTNYNTEEQSWSGNLRATSVTDMYKVKTSLPSGETLPIQLAGAVVDPTHYPIELAVDWNYLGYPLSESVNVGTVFYGFAENGDYVKSQDAFAEYYNGTWHGNLKSMNPGEGYMYQRSTAGTFTYSYPSTREAVKANVTSENNYWVPASSQYANNMTMVAVLDVKGGDYEVAAFVGGEVRGSARPVYIESLDAYMFFLTIHGDEVEEMSFKCYDLATGEEYDLNNRMNYSNDAVVGSIGNPYVLSRGTTGIGESAMSEVNIYPNPTTTGREVNLGSVCDTVEVFNALGVKVAEYQNVDTIDALETAGIYVIRITNNGNVQNCRLIVK